MLDQRKKALGIDGSGRTGIGVPRDTSLSSAQQERFRQNLQQDLQRKGGIAGLGQMGLGGDPRFAGLGQMGLGGDPRFAGLGQSQRLGQRIPQMDQAQQMRMMQMMQQRQALPAQQFVPQAQQPQPSSMAGMNLGVGLNPLFGRAFAGKPV